MTTQTIRKAFFFASTFIVKAAFATSLHVCANGIYYVTPLNSNGTPAGPTVVSGNCSGGDWACVSELMVSGGGNTSSGPGAEQALLAIEAMNVDQLNKIKLIKSGPGQIVGNINSGFTVVGYRKRFTPDKLSLDTLKLNPLAVGFLTGLEVQGK